MDTTLPAPSRSRAMPAILVGGLVSGALDITSAFIVYGWGVPRFIAGGLLGPGVTQSGTGPWILGMLLHFFITCVAAAVYYLASRSLTFMREYPFVCGLFFGIAIFLVMTFIVVPLSALHNTGPYHLPAMIRGLLIHMFLVGLPIAYSVRAFAR